MTPEIRKSNLEYLRKIKSIPENLSQKRYVFFDNKNRPIEQVQELLTTIIDNLCQQNGPYTNHVFREAQAGMEADLRNAIQGVEAKLEREIQAERQRIEKEHKIRIDEINQRMREMQENNKEEDCNFEEEKRRLKEQLQKAEKEKDEEI